MITALKGGVPIVVDGQVVGAVGVGGGTGEQDAEVAQAAIDLLLKTLEVESKSRWREFGAKNDHTQRVAQSERSASSREQSRSSVFALSFTGISLWTEYWQ